MKAIEKPQIIINTTLFILLATIVFILTMSGCMNERVEGNRDLMTEDRTSKDFTEVVSQGNFNVIIIPDSETRIVVKAESNILPYLYTTSNGTTLNVGFINGYAIREHYPVEVFLYTPDISSIRLSGSGNAECKGFSSDDVTLRISGSGSIEGDFVTENLDASISGSGNMNLDGIVKNSTLKISGSGNINTLDMSQENCGASISGSGKIIAAVSKTLDVHITGSGSIYYIGNPVITTHITGSGKVLKY
jgi:carbon monoxide dehydrogenase subunit G